MVMAIMERPVSADAVLAALDELSIPEGFRAELIEGEIVVTPPPVGDHEDILGLIGRQIARNAASELYLSGTKGLIVPGGRFIPDGTVAPAGHFRGKDPWMKPDGVILVIEVTSTNPHRDREQKRRGYAAAKIPLYMLVDRESAEVVLYSEPRDGRYLADVRVPFGKSLDLPEPLSFTLDTGRFV